MNREFVKKNRFVFSLLAIFFILLSFSFIVRENGLLSTGEIKGFGDLLPTPALYPTNNRVSTLPELTARSVFVIDANSSVVLYKKDPDLRLMPASTTKIMTALVALEQYSLQDVLVVGKMEIDGNTLDLQEGERMTVESLLYGLLVGSGNDAAEVLAENFPQGVSGFVWTMNKKAEEYGLKDTHFQNPIGLDDSENYTTTHDLATLAQIALKNPVFSRIVSTSGLTITDISGSITHTLQNTNELVVKYAWVKGVKTGWTQNAGECLVSLIEKDEKKIIIVLLGSEDRFGETQILTDWIFDNFSWETIAPPKYQ